MKLIKICLYTQDLLNDSINGMSIENTVSENFIGIIQLLIPVGFYIQ